MTINTNQATEIKNLLREKIKDKLKTYERETSSMPFLAKLMQDTVTTILAIPYNPYHPEPYNS